MKFLQELVESKQSIKLDEGAMKLKLYDAIHTAVNKGFNKNQTLKGNLAAATAYLVKDKDAGISAQEAKEEMIQDMIADHIDARIDSLIAAKIWVASSEKKVDKDEAIAELKGLKSFAHIPSDELEHRVSVAMKNIKYDKRLPIRESEDGLDGLYQALQNARSEMRVLYQDGGLSDEAASTWKMIIDNLMRAVRKEDIEEFKKLYHEYAKERPDAFEAIMDTVYGYLGVSTYEELAKKTLKEAAVPVKADEFKLEVDFDQVHLLDGEKSIRVSMPLKTWLKLAKQSISRYG